MINLNQKTKDRLIKGIKKYKPIIKKARDNDINESDTVTIITDILCNVFGFDKYEEITSEYAIKKTYCDLAIKLDNKIKYLIECKAAGLDLKDEHVRQAISYCANSGIEWVVLTNAVEWRIYRVVFSQPVEKVLVYSFNFAELQGKDQKSLENLYYLSKESFAKNSKANLDDLFSQKQIVNRYIIGNILLTEASISSLRKYAKKLYPDIAISDEELGNLLRTEIVKREIIEGDNAEDAHKKVVKAVRALERKAKTK